MKILEIKMNNSVVHLIYLYNEIKYMDSFIAETPEKVVEVINEIIKTLPNNDRV